MNRSMAAKHLKAKKCAMKDFIENDNHRLAGGGWKTPYLKWMWDHEPYSLPVQRVAKRAVSSPS